MTKMAAAVPALAIAALSAGCVDGGIRRMRMDASTSDTNVDLMFEEVGPPFTCASAVAPLNCAAPA